RAVFINDSTGFGILLVSSKLTGEKRLHKTIRHYRPCTPGSVHKILKNEKNGIIHLFWQTAREYNFRPVKNRSRDRLRYKNGKFVIVFPCFMW
ncbi:MAG TPA: hypothetical protein DEB39_01640, partial [Planctomycetaceae bacterium]|nr:hypothetical protein [Planctomycetaceae bacterium]